MNPLATLRLPAGAPIAAERAIDWALPDVKATVSERMAKCDKRRMLRSRCMVRSVPSQREVADDSGLVLKTALSTGCTVGERLDLVAV